MSVHDDAVCMFLGDVQYPAVYLDSKNNHHGALVGTPSWELDDSTIRRPFLQNDTPHSSYANVTFAERPVPGSFTVHFWARFPSYSGGGLGAMLATTSPATTPHTSGGVFLAAASMTEDSFLIGLRDGHGQVWNYVSGNKQYGHWMSIGAFFDSANSRLGMYFNGILSIDRSAAGFTVLTNLLIARGGNNSAYTKRVDMASVALWGRLLTAQEHKRLADPRYLPNGIGRRGFPTSRIVN